MQRGISAPAGLLIIMNLAVFGSTGWLIWRANHPHTTTPALTQSATISNDKTVTSAKNSFTLTFPAGWDSVLRVMDSDRFVVEGPDQPEFLVDRAAKITDVISFAAAKDKDVVFDAAVGSGFAAPDGDASDFLAGSGKSLLSGRKYLHVYQGDDLTGQRSNGDKDYIYSFALGGSRELRVTYRVFAADPTDNSTVVDGIVRSIRRT